MNLRRLIHKFFPLLRVDHWTKNIVIITGYAFALIVLNKSVSTENLKDLIVVFIATSLASSANYVINEYLDRNTDRYHPIKKERKAVKFHYELIEILVLYSILTTISLILAGYTSRICLILLIIFLLFGILYNVPPVRLKDLAIVDIYFESLNSPVRFILGWIAVNNLTIPPASLILSFWIGGAFLMTAKRISEVNLLKNAKSTVSLEKYRKSFKYYTESNLFFVAVLNIGFTVSLLTIFALKYNPNSIIFLPVVIVLFAFYTMNTISNKTYIVENPHYLYKDRLFIGLLILGLLLYILLNILNLNFISWLLNSSQLSIANLF